MRGSSKGLVAWAVALLLAVGLAACGGGDDSSPTATSAGATSQTEAEGEGSPEASGEGESSSFTPKQHSDSGGGSQQYKVKGGDNSVQELGEEADDSEREAAAAALHNFLDARAQGDWAAACTYMAKSITDGLEKLAARAKQVEDKSCGGILGKLTNPEARQSLKDEAAQADVGSLRIEGEHAFLIYTGLDGTVIAMPMADEDGTWKVASLTGAPLN